MDDRTLLERAAKAAGLQVKGWVGDDLSYFDPICEHAGAGDWNPLKSDCDALRLAVKLRLHVDHNSCRVTAWAIQGEDASPFTENGKDNSATRRAIVRAAASLCPEEC